MLVRFCEFVVAYQSPRARQQNFEGWLKKLETCPDGFSAGIDTAEFVFRGANCALVDDWALWVSIAHWRAAFASSILSPHSLDLWSPARAGTERSGGCELVPRLRRLRTIYAAHTVCTICTVVTIGMGCMGEESFGARAAGRCLRFNHFRPGFTRSSRSSTSTS